MLKLYFGNVPNILSTLLFVFFIVFFVITLKRPEGGRKWKKAALITLLMGTAMSALSGIKDTVADTMAVSFEEMNFKLAILCVLGGMAVLFGVVAAFCKKEKINKVIFFILSFIIISKTIIVEVLRIAG